MKRFLLLFLPLFLAAESSMLQEAEAVSKKYSLEIAKAPPPSPSPLTQKSLDAGSIYFSIDLNEISICEGESIFQTLAQEALWDKMREIGVQVVYLKGLKKGGAQRTGISIDPQWGTAQEWEGLASLLQKKGIAWMGDAIGESIGLTADFFLALKNVGDYPDLYHLIEIDKADWKVLPLIPQGSIAANVPWLSLQELYKKGYVPEHFTPYVKESDWNATDRVEGVDGKARRWIYLKENKTDPVLDWLAPSFAAMRLATGDSLDSFYKLGFTFFHLPSDLTSQPQETLPLWLRKMGAFSLQEIDGGIANIQGSNADLIFDSWTQAPLLHALISEDAEVLRLIYRLFLDADLQLKRLNHVLQSFDPFACQWAEFASNPKKQFRYHEEFVTGEVLQKRLMQTDLLNLISHQSTTWTGYCALALGAQDLYKQRDTITQAHLLLAFFYAMQPGAFSFSVSDLVGALPTSCRCFDLLGVNETTLYPSLPIQLSNKYSFAAGLKRILTARRDYDLASTELVDVPRTSNRSVLILILRMRNSSFMQILAINFGKDPVQEPFELPWMKDKTAINLMTQKAENKSFDSSQFCLHLPPLSGKAILFQPKYYD